MYAQLAEEENRIGLNALLKKYNVPSNPLKEAVGFKMDLYNDYWKRRPLTEEQLQYAVGDVFSLLDVFHKLQNEIEAKNHKFLLSLSELYGLQYLSSARIGLDLILEFNEKKEKIFKPVKNDDASEEVVTVPGNEDLLSLLPVLPSKLGQLVLKTQEGAKVPVTEVALDLVS
jgi:hypothetical protein